MLYLLVQIFSWITLTFLVAFLLGWWIRSLIGFEKATSRKIRELEAKLELLDPDFRAGAAKSAKASQEPVNGGDIGKGEDKSDEDLSSLSLSSHQLEFDDLRSIKGIGPRLSERLADEGIVKYEHIAELSDDDIERLDALLKLSGRIHRDEWVAQARRMIEQRSA